MHLYGGISARGQAAGLVHGCQRCVQQELDGIWLDRKVAGLGGPPKSSADAESGVRHNSVDANSIDSDSGDGCLFNNAANLRTKQGAKTSQDLVWT